MKALSPNHWTAREFPSFSLSNDYFIYIAKPNDRIIQALNRGRLRRKRYMYQNLHWQNFSSAFSPK